MSAPRTFIASVIAFFALFASWTTAKYVNTAAGEFDGIVKVYTGINYQNLLLSINVSYPNECYNIDCSYLVGKTASAAWTELPKTEVTGKTYMVFYSDSSCKGNAAIIRYNNGIPVFPANVKGRITSFMVKSPSEDLDNGVADICMWAGASDVGGSVSEDNMLTMVIPNLSTV